MTFEYTKSTANGKHLADPDVEAMSGICNICFEMAVVRSSTAIISHSSVNPFLFNGL